jgi:hypothetical protein
MLVFDLCVVVLVALSTAGVLAGFALYYADREVRREAVAHSWERWALARAHHFVPAEGSWPNRTSPRVEGTSEWGDFAIETRHKGDAASTRVVGHPHGALCARVVCTTGPAAATEKIGLASFDAEFAVCAAPRGAASRIVDAELARALQAFAMGGSLRFEYERGHIALEWRGEEQSDARLDEALRLLAVAARGVERAFRAAA